MPMTPKQMIRLLEQNGFVLVSANGSHYKYHNPTTNKTTLKRRNSNFTATEFVDYFSDRKTVH